MLLLLKKESFKGADKSRQREMLDTPGIWPALCSACG